MPDQTSFFVGRQAQLDELNGHWNDVSQNNQARVVFLTGEAGIGKTSLVEQFGQDVLKKERTNIQYAYTQCDQLAGSNSSYAPFFQLLQELAQEPKNLRFGWFVDFMSKIGPDLLKLVPILGNYLAFGAKAVGFAWDRLIAEAKAAANDPLSPFGQQDLFQKFCDTFKDIACDRNPLLLVVDDWHWADASSTNLLFYWARHLNEAPILLLATYRPEDAKADKHPILKVHSQLKRYQPCPEVWLDFLSRAEVEDYLNRRFPTATFDETLVDQLIKITSGNALFTTEYINLLIQKNLLTNTGELKGSLTLLPPPASVEAVIETRLGFLNDLESNLLVHASVEGEEFTVFVLGQLLNRETIPLLIDLRKIRKKHDLIVDQGLQTVYQQETTVFRFTHILIHHTLFAMLGSEGQEKISRRILNILAEIYNRADKETKAKMTPDLISHAANARDYQAEIRYALMAAKEGARRFAHTEVFKHCHLILEVVDQRELPVTKKIPAYHYLGRTYRQLKQYAKAETIYNEIIRIKPNYAPAYRNRGRVYFDWRKYPQALIDFNKSITLKPTSFFSYYLRASVHRRLNQYAQAIADYTQAIDLNPTYYVDFRDRGRVYAQQKNYQKAIADYNEAIGLEPNSAFTYDLRGNAYRQLGDDEQAIADYSQAIEIDPNYYVAFRDRGRVYAAREDYQQAIDDFKRAIELKPGSAFLYALRGDAYQQLGNYEQALTDYQRYLDLEPRSSRRRKEIQRKLQALTRK